MVIARPFLILLLIVFATVGQLIAQSSHTFKQPAHTFLNEVPWKDSIYLYPDFRSGVITYFTDFTTRDLRLNYNLYFAQIDMIDLRGDTVQILPLKTFKSVSIGSDVFLYDHKEGYLRVLIQGDVVLAERVLLGMGGSAINSFRSRPAESDRYFTKASTFFFVNSAGKPFRVSRATLKKLFPEHKTAIKEYTREHATNFSKEADIRQVTLFCNNLRRK